MTHHKQYQQESQDARRHDKHDATHPDMKDNKNKVKTDQNHSKKK